jgi:hypothetical protein
MRVRVPRTAQIRAGDQVPGTGVPASYSQVPGTRILKYFRRVMCVRVPRTAQIRAERRAGVWHAYSRVPGTAISKYFQRVMRMGMGSRRPHMPPATGARHPKSQPGTSAGHPSSQGTRSPKYFQPISLVPDIPGARDPRYLGAEIPWCRAPKTPNIFRRLSERTCRRASHASAAAANVHNHQQLQVLTNHLRRLGDVWTASPEVQHAHPGVRNMSPRRAKHREQRTEACSGGW